MRIFWARKTSNYTGICLQALAGARSNAEEAHRNAQEAQEKYAEQASDDADAIRRQANETKSAARTLRSEADHLNGRVAGTEHRISQLRNLAQQDIVLTEEAKEKVRYIEVRFCLLLENIRLNSYSGWSSELRLCGGQKPGRESDEGSEGDHRRAQWPPTNQHSGPQRPR